MEISSEEHQAGTVRVGVRRAALRGTSKWEGFFWPDGGRPLQLAAVVWRLAPVGGIAALGLGR